jgi:branched-chain amino acid transport system ATP-binding protein
MTSPDIDVAKPPRLSATGITVRFGGLLALDDVAIEIPAGCIVGLIGPNGAGKSTLFSVLSGLRKPQAGRVLIDGDDVTATGARTRAGLGLARTFQHPELFQGLTVREHLTLAYRLKHSPRRMWTDLFNGGGLRRPAAAETERIDLLVEGLNLTRIQHDPVMGLPLGLARMVEIARSIAREPSVLLLDEASSGLDAGETEELAAVLKALVRTRGVSLLLVEHDVDLVLGLSDRVYVLDFGIRIADGTPAEIRGNPRVRAAYLGEQIEDEAQPA